MATRRLLLAGRGRRAELRQASRSCQHNHPVPAELREQLEPLTKMALIRRCAALRPGALVDPTSAAKHTLRAIARRWLALDAEIKTHETGAGQTDHRAGS